jgi:hypothetical protein
MIVKFTVDGQFISLSNLLFTNKSRHISGPVFSVVAVTLLGLNGNKGHPYNPQVPFATVGLTTEMVCTNGLRSSYPPS